MSRASNYRDLQQQAGRAEPTQLELRTSLGHVNASVTQAGGLQLEAGNGAIIIVPLDDVRTLVNWVTNNFIDDEEY